MALYSQTPSYPSHPNSQQPSQYTGPPPVARSPFGVPTNINPPNQQQTQQTTPQLGLYPPTTSSHLQQQQQHPRENTQQQQQQQHYPGFNTQQQQTNTQQPARSPFGATLPTPTQTPFMPPQNTQQPFGTTQQNIGTQPTAKQPYPQASSVAHDQTQQQTSKQPYYPAATQAHIPQGAVYGYQENANERRDQMIREALECNALPHFVRSTVSRVPNSSSVKQKTHIPIGFVTQPLAPTPAGYPDVASINFGSNGSVVRCKRCRTYINPFVQWEANGRRWICCCCGYTNDTPQFYYCNLDDQMKRADRHEKPELSCGSVEFIAPGDYMVRPPQPPAFMFVIDVSAGAVETGLLDTVTHSVKSALHSGLMPGCSSRLQVGIITFDSTVHFYNLSPTTGSSPHMYVVPDLADPFVPLPDGILVNVCERMESLDQLLDDLPKLWHNQTVKESCMGTAMKAAQLAMESVGGKIIVFTSTLPSLGESPVNPHRFGNTRGSNPSQDRETELLIPANDDYKKMAETLTQRQITADLFVCPQGQQQMDLATMSCVAKHSGGDIRYYPGFHAHLFGDKLRQEIIHDLTRETGWEAVMRFRVSRGWRVTSWFGHYWLRGAGLLVVPSCHSDQTFSICVELEENQVVQDPFVYLQSALLYTNSNSERRIRVHTYCLPVTPNPAEVISSIDIPTTCYILAQQALAQAQTSKLASARNFIQASAGQIMSCAGASAENLYSLPMYTLGLLKSVAFRDTRDVPSDFRIFHWLRLESLPVDMMIAYCYPRLLSLHNLDAQHGNLDHNNRTILPDPLSLTHQQLSQEGVYVLEDGETMMMWIGKAVNPNWLTAVFGVPSTDQLHPDFSEQLIGCTGDNLGTRVAAIINCVRSQRKPPFMKLHIIRQGDPNEYKLFMGLIEDKSHAMNLSLAEYMQSLAPRVVTTGVARGMATVQHRQHQQQFPPQN